MHHYTDYRWLRGFNIIPSWGARIEQAWWEYDPSRFREEAALATQTHANCIRLWIESPLGRIRVAGTWISSRDMTMNHKSDEECLHGFTTGRMRLSFRRTHTGR